MSNSENTDYFEELVSFLSQYGIEQRRIDMMRFNIVNSLSDPRIIGEIIQIRYPKILPSRSITEGNSTTIRLGNWELLNLSLKTLRCELTADQLSYIANKRMPKEELISFYLLLRVKLDSFEPIYLTTKTFNSTSSTPMKSSTLSRTDSSGRRTSTKSPAKKTMLVLQVEIY